MNPAYFGLHRRPFLSTPDLNGYFPSPSHEAALEWIESAFADCDSVASIDGEAGTGKTLLALRFMSRLTDQASRSFLPACRFRTSTELHQAILFDAGVPYHGLSEQELRLAVINYFLTRLEAGDPVVLVLDEAHHLNAELLEEVRLFGNLETSSRKAVFILLVGLPKLRDQLNAPEVAPLAHRLSAKVTLGRLSQAESVEFVRHQLKSAGGQADQLITDEALALLAKASDGLPRLLNKLSSTSFSLCQAGGENQVDVEVLMEALSKYGITVPESEPEAEQPAEVLPHPAKKRGRPPSQSKVESPAGRRQASRRKSA